MHAVFYQMMATSLEKTLPRLLEKIYEQHQRAVVLLSDLERLKLIDDILWTFGKLSFVPHGSALKQEQFKSRQPIWLTVELENPNEADVLVITNNQFVEPSSRFKRYLDLFDGQDPEQVEFAKKRLANYQTQGCDCTWWLQSLDGKWGQIPLNTSV